MIKITRITKLLKGGNLTWFAGGVVATKLVGAYKDNKKVRDFCVNAVALGIKAKDSAEETLQDSKEYVQDLYYDAQKKIEAEGSEPEADVQ